MKTKLLPFILLFISSGCLKDQDYKYDKVYTAALKTVTISYDKDSLPADGNSTMHITFDILPANKKDSFNLSTLNLIATTTNGIFTENGMQSITVVPTYKLDALTNERVCNAIITLQSSTKLDTAKLKFKFLGVEQDKSIPYFKAYPNKLKLSVSSLIVTPDFKTSDTIIAQLSSSTGLPSSGTEVTINAFDSLYKKKLGIFRLSNNKSNAFGQCSFIYSLGDYAINQINYTGTIYLVGYATSPTGITADTFHIFSRQ